MSAVLEPELTVSAPQRTPHEYYSRERKAEVLALVDANGGNVLRTSQDTGIHHATIRYWLDDPRFSELQKQKTKDLDSILEKTAHKYINSIYSHDLEETPLNQKAQAFGIVFDKLQLIRNQPTSITEHVNSDSITVVLQSVLNELNVTD